MFKTERSDYDHTYSDLKLFMEILGSSKTHFTKHRELIDKLNARNVHTFTVYRALVGFAFLGISIERALSEFRSNRYFVDSVGIPTLPSKDQIDYALNNKINERQTISSYDYIVLAVNELIVEANNQFKNISDFKNQVDPSVSLPSSDDLRKLDKQGFLVVENAISHDYCDHLLEVIQHVRALEETSSKGGYFYGSGRMQRIYNLLAKHNSFHQLLLNPIVNSVMSHMFHRATFHDKYYLTSFHGNILNSGAEPQVWHVDANVPDPLPEWIIRANSNYIIQDYTCTNGATEVIPGSHKWCKKPTLAEINNEKKNSIQMTAPKGSIVFWHGHLWHRSGENKSKNKRVALLAAYSASFFREVCMEENPYLHIDLSTSTKLDPRLKSILGWEHGNKDYQ